ncbi:MAG: glycerophosphodiester phosphodiesterase [bacterium]
MKHVGIWMGILMILATPAQAADTKPRIIAHRGYSRVAPENTLASARRALALNPPPEYIELDLHRSRDGVLVVSHDDNTLRATGVEGRIREQTFEWLRALDAGCAPVFGEAFKGEKIPRFEEILDAVKDTPVGIMIECKQLLLEEQVIGILRKRNELGKHVLASFDELTIYRAKQLEPSLRTLYLVESLSPPVLGRARDLKADIIGVNLKADPADVAKAHAAGFQVWVWTVDDPETMKTWAAAGVEGLITNDPALGLKTVRGS